jgi:Concanavalin A-like lectin/glucanases superfamily/PA14 domain
VPVDHFSARWTGMFSFGAGSYEFTATADDGIRVWVDDTLVIDAWVDQAPTTYTAPKSLTAGNHEVRVEYYENDGGAVARVSWELIPPPPPPPSSCPVGEYLTAYYENMTLAGTPVLQRCETAINYDWGFGSPSPSVPANQFSARWTGTFSFTAGSYDFTATADDGIRVWVDGAPVIDAWVDQAPTTYQATRSLTAGNHEVKVEYYENGGGAVAQVSWVRTGGGGDTTAPDAPTGLAASVTGSTVNLTWNAASDNVGVTHYNLHRSTTSGFTATSGNRIAQPTGTSYADTGRPPGTYHYRVTAEDAAGNVGPPSSQVSATVVNNPPTASIATPPATTTWKVGDVISFSGSASDPEQGTLPASALSWTLILHHCPSNCHTHTVQTWTGVASGSFTAPDHDYPSHLELRLTATDSGGQSDSESVELQPQTVALSFATEPSGLQLVVGSASQAAPFTRTVIVGSQNSISAPTPQSLGGTPYAFSSWSDGGAQTHNITAPAAPATYTATYAEGTPPDAPTGLAASVTGSTVNLSWNAASDNVGVTHYNLHRSTTSGFTPTSGNRIAQPTGTSYADTGRPPGTYHYRVTAEDAAGNVSAPSSQASATVVNNAPSAVITTPAPTTTWKVGDVISFSGSASDPEQGTLPASALSWTLIQHHCPSTCHTHTVQTWTGVASGSFTAPDHDYPSHLELRLTATDSGGQSDSESVELQPQTVALTFATEPSGLQLVVDSASQAYPSQAAPFTRTVIVGSTNSISATSPQSQGGKVYVFTSWSDGGAQTHNIVAPATPATYTATYLEAPVVPGLVAAYSFDEANGATVFDLSGTGNHGTISGATRNTAGQYGAALDFDGTNDLVTVPDASSLDLTTGMTLEAWVRPLTTSGWRTALIKEQPGNLVYSLYSSNNDNGRPQGRIRVNGSNFFINGSSRLTTSVWAHLAATYDGTNLRLYVNGSLVGTRAASGAMVNSANPLRIGGSSVLGRWFRGRIDEVRVYNRALSATEIQNDRTTPLTQTAAARRGTAAPAATQGRSAFGRFVAAVLRF